MLDIAVPVGGRHLVDAVRVPGRQPRSLAFDQSVGETEPGPSREPMAKALSSLAGSGPGDVLPGQVPVGARLAGEAEDALAQDVAHDLGSTPLDGVGPGAEELLAGVT